MSSIEKLGMPKWGLSMTEGKLLDWLVKEGSELVVGDEVAEVETEKITGAVESPAAGVLRRRVAAVGDVVPVGGLLGVIADVTVPPKEIDAFVADFQASFVPGQEEEDGGPAPDTVSVEAGTLRYLRQGDGGEPVVLLHGFGGDLNNWLFTAPALAGERAVYALDLPGHGGSSKDVGSGALDVLARAVLQFLGAEGLERVHLIGHSLGGLVAATVALEHPERVRSLTLVAGAGLGEEINRDYVEGFVSASGRRELKPVLQLLFADESLVTRQLVEDVLKYKRIDGVGEALRAIADGMADEGGQRTVIADRLGELEAPLLVVWGREDRIFPVAHAERLPRDADLHVLDGVGHAPHMEAAGEVNRILERFLAGVPTS
jgi:pyruvate dehydrogenase E2 component (dihydrolipoamide acetyltransferase)